MDWEPWLRRWSEEWVRSSEPDELDPDVLCDRWLGFAPAAPEAVAAAEARLGVVLPPSYREFLLTTDGWRDAGMFVWRMRDTGNLAWLRDVEPYWEEWEDLGYENATPSGENRFTRGLMISLETDAGVLFLDPGDVDDQGEWAAYSLFSWHAAPPVRFQSFTALMESLYAEFHQMRRPEGETRDATDASVEQARIDALAGAADDAGARLAQAEEFGSELATLLRVQLLFFQDRSYETEMLLGRLLYSSLVAEGLFEGSLFAEEILPLLFVQHARNASVGHNSLLQSALTSDRPDLLLPVARHQARLRRGDHRLNYGNPEFDAPVREALEQHAADPDALWEAVLDALPHWRPRSAAHIAPIVLLAEPLLARTLTPERGHRLLATPRGDR
ncbi:SMI1/KNR4 family protein [Actinomadura hibisca]|uniref:SMI1/KNR4 family protein n=1 Tax=Actinomadura hibisca TaxID=68565 RepID=UPI00082E9C5F|nr:SMI1/KNR4 family protein [Actinomadura hibisca]